MDHHSPSGRITLIALSGLELIACIGPLLASKQMTKQRISEVTGAIVTTIFFCSTRRPSTRRETPDGGRKEIRRSSRPRLLEPRPMG